MLLIGIGYILPWQGVAAEQIEIVGTIDGTDRIIIQQDGATWEHLSGDLAVTAVRVNGILWQPSANPRLENSGATAFIPDKVLFPAARLQVREGRDTVVLQQEKDHMVLSIGDTPNGPANYHVVITFPESYTLLVEAEIDGSDELQISFAGALWQHKHWGGPGSVRLNGVDWNARVTPYLANAGATTFLPAPVEFENAVVLEQSGRDLLAMRPGKDGLVIHFADDPVGAGNYRALIAFPPSEPVPAPAIPFVTAAEIGMVDAAAIAVETVRGIWYELQAATDLAKNDWVSTGSFLRGNGGVMTLFDPRSSQAAKFYRVVSRSEP